MRSLRHAGIVVSDMGESLHFYRDILRLKVVNDFREEGDYIETILGLKKVKLHMVKLIAEDGSMVELLHYPSHCKARTTNRRICDIGCSHIAFTVRDIDMEYRRLTGYGIEFISLPCVSPDGYAKVAFTRDPDGFFIELVEVLAKDGNSA